MTIDALGADNTASPLAKLTKSLLFKGQHLPPADPSESASHLALGRLAIKDFSNTRVLERLLMYERRIEHSLYKTILELQRLNLVKKLNTEYELPLNPFTVQPSHRFTLSPSNRPTVSPSHRLTVSPFNRLCKTNPISERPK